MSTDATFQIALILATLLCSLVAGFLFAFATVVMPGIKTLNDREFIRAFQVIDGVIQNNQPLFVAVWMGSVVASVTSAGLGFRQLDGVQRLLLLSAPLIYILGVQLSTFTINVPLNNKLQALNVDAMDEAALQAARIDFEPGWNRWNLFRTPFAGLASVLFMILLFRL
ncbi:integral-membrane protein [Leptolyngbya sp. Heron Island J]|uniref:anthrone oxygenase family protein n=1 Tax=Leptolyngbya sp. Heron Island J TaxID=1385935 RepID=UPI0003B9960A|nr:anthrone oxygenase family protein [Leptolyngbya sp. Heron Island J]ESA33834.1 integral-membrane protein [Leptolyngbya sp. Heron Island J]